MSDPSTTADASQGAGGDGQDPGAGAGPAMLVERDVPVEVRDGTVLRADVFRPADGRAVPVLMTHGPYGKDIHFQDFNPAAYAKVDERGEHMNWETVNPQWWVPRGYAVVRVDQRGTGASPGRMDLFSPEEFEDFHDAVEWAGTRSWSTGRVALVGVSYYAIGQWHVAALRPPHLAAIVPWEGAVDLYRDWTHHGGILANAFTDAWWPRQITGNQHVVVGAENPRAAVGGNVDFPAAVAAHPLVDGFYEQRVADLAAIDVPLLSEGNWSSFALHLRGNVEGFLAAGTERKWLRVHGGNHYTPFYSPEGREVLDDFLRRWLHEDASAWQDRPRVSLSVRDGESLRWRSGREWPLESTTMTPYYLDAATGALSTAAPTAPASVTYTAPGGCTTFLTAPQGEPLELAGPVVLALSATSGTEEMDVFVTLFHLDAQGHEVTYEDASGNRGPVTKGWLRLSHRELDEERSTPWRPWHPHRSTRPLVPGEAVEALVEVMPTGVRLEAGHRLGLVVGSADRTEPSRFGHDDPVDRDPQRLAGANTLHTGVPLGGGLAPHLLLPVLPAQDT